MNMVQGRWFNGFDTDTVARDMEEVGPLGLVRALVRQRRFYPSGPPCDEYNVAAHLVLVSLIFLRVRERFGWPLEWTADVLCTTRTKPSPVTS